MRVRRITINNFRDVSTRVVNFPGHTLLVGDNTVGKSTVWVWFTMSARASVTVKKNRSVETLWLRVGTPAPLAARCSW
jgi:predicted ATPase